MPANALDLLVGRCHSLAEQVATLPPLAVLQEVQGLAATIPLAPTLHEQLLGRARRSERERWASVCANRFIESAATAVVATPEKFISFCRCAVES